jgi:hypothetical protein
VINLSELFAARPTRMELRHGTMLVGVLKMEWAGPPRQGKPEPVASWGALKDLLRKEIQTRGFPRKGEEVWSNTTNVARTLMAWAEEEFGEHPGLRTARTHAREMLNELRAEPWAKTAPGYSSNKSK